jgi:3-phosphoshikimate 1-carboxyvinyltransferase
VAHRGAWPLKAIDLDCNHIPDAAMTLAVMALYADGTTTLRNIASWRVKETDRIAAMATELRKLGATVVEGAGLYPASRRIASGPPCAKAAQHPHLRRPSHGHVFHHWQPLTRPGCRYVLKTRNAWRKHSPITLKRCSAVGHCRHCGPSPSICVDGPTASGKGTLAAVLAQQAGLALSGLRLAVPPDWAWPPPATGHRASIPPNEAGPGRPGLASLSVRFDADTHILMDGEDVSDAIRTEAGGYGCVPRIGISLAVRTGVAGISARCFRPPARTGSRWARYGHRGLPGMQALKVFLTASAERRAQRRYKQLISKGISATLDSLRSDLEARDARDSSRSVAPLKPAQDAQLLDNSDLSVEESVDRVLGWWQGKQPF